MNESTTGNIQLGPPGDITTLESAMDELGAAGYHVMVRIDPLRKQARWTVLISYGVLCERTDTDSPLVVVGEFWRHHRYLQREEQR